MSIHLGDTWQMGTVGTKLAAKSKLQNIKDKPSGKGKVIIYAMAFPHDIANVIELNWLSKGREITEKIIIKLYECTLHGAGNSRTYQKMGTQTFP